MRQDIAIVGGGLAGSVAAAIPGRACIRAVLVDPDASAVPEFSGREDQRKPVRAVGPHRTARPGAAPLRLCPQGLDLERAVLDRAALGALHRLVRAGLGTTTA